MNDIACIIGIVVVYICMALIRASESKSDANGPPRPREMAPFQLGFDRGSIRPVKQDSLDLTKIGLKRRTTGTYVGTSKGTALTARVMVRGRSEILQIKLQRVRTNQSVCVIRLGNNTSLGVQVIRHTELDKTKHGLFAIESDDLGRVEKILRSPKIDTSLHKIEQRFSRLQVQTLRDQLVAEVYLDEVGDVMNIKTLIRLLTQLSHVL